MRPTTRNGWKTCSRGHKYRGMSFCPKCNPGRATRSPAAGSQRGGSKARSAARR